MRVRFDIAIRPTQNRAKALLFLRHALPREPFPIRSSESSEERSRGMRETVPDWDQHWQSCVVRADRRKTFVSDLVQCERYRRVGERTHTEDTNRFHKVAKGLRVKSDCPHPLPRPPRSIGLLRNAGSAHSESFSIHLPPCSTSFRSPDLMAGQIPLKSLVYKSVCEPYPSVLSL